MKLGDAELPDRPGIRTGGWRQSGSLAVGGQAINGGQPALRFQVSFYAVGDPRQRPASEYTLSFNVDTCNTAFRKVNPVATVTFSSEGNSFTRKFSLVNGVSISGVCEHVSVVVEDATVNFGGGPVPPLPPGTEAYVVTMVVTPGTRPGGFIPPYLRGGTAPLVLAAGASSEFLIPNDAGVETVMVYACGTNGGVPLALQRDAIGTVLACWDPTNPAPVALFPQAEDVRITNVGAIGTVTASMLFGVDG